MAKAHSAVETKKLKYNNHILAPTTFKFDIYVGKVLPFFYLIKVMLDLKIESM